MRKISTLVLLLFVASLSKLNAQTMACPPNIDFEWGTTANWTFYTGTCCPITTPTMTPPINGRHNLTVGATTDYYGGFPIVSPGGGSYSMRLGYDTTNRLASRARYYVRIPTGSVNYALIYRYAVVLEDPSHDPTDQPRFTVDAFDSATNITIPCATYNYVASSSLGGFALSTMPSRQSGSLDVQYKGWQTATINLTGLGGTTVAIDFAAGDCDLGGHFGYGYFDMSCGLFQVSGLTCDDTATTSTLSGPFGYMTYRWFDSATFTVLYGTTQTITIPIPAGPTTYALILTPYTGYGCPDTLYTRLSPSHLALSPTTDTVVCNGFGTTITSGATDVALPLTYSWSPATGLSCTTCANPIASPTTPTSYTVTVTNVMGCVKQATINVAVGNVSVTTTKVDETCDGYNNGSATAVIGVGTAPFSYVWNTTPVQTTPTATGLGDGTYSVVVTDAVGCRDTAAAIVNPGDTTILSIVGHTDPTTCGGNEGTIQLTGLTPSTTFTITYLFGGIPQSQTLTASGTGSVTLTGLYQGVYSNIGVVITSGCPYNVVGPITLVDPPNPFPPIPGSNTPICLNNIINLTAMSATPGVTYSWTGPGGYTSGAQNPTIFTASYADIGYYVVTVEINNCFSKDSTLVNVIPNPIPVAGNGSPTCTGDTVFLTSSSSNGATSFSWLGPDGFYAYSANTSLPNAAISASGTYTVTVTLNGCKATATTDVIMNQTPAPPTAASGQYCQYDAATQLSGSGSGGTVLWYDVPVGGVGSATAPTPSTAQPGTTTWYLSEISAAGCEGGRSQVSVYVEEQTNPIMEITDSAVCRGAEILLFAKNTGSAMTDITWYFDDGDSMKNMNPIRHSFDQTGTFNVSATAHFQICPEKIVNRTIRIFPSPDVYLGGDTVICPGGLALILRDDKNADDPTVSWLWNTGSTQSFITVTKPGTYHVKTSIGGCYSTDTVIVNNDCYMSLPNVFSPNGDGVNDYFFPRQLLTRGLTSFSMEIYNRWGQLVYSTKGIDGRGWDGKFNDVPQPQGVFVYMIDATFKDGQKESHTGNVTLLR